MLAALSVPYPIVIAFAGLFACLVAFTLYLGVRGRVFLPRAPEKEDPLDKDARLYMDAMKKLIQAVDAQSPDLGTDRFGDAVYRDFVEQLSRMPPPTGSPYFSQDVAYRGALESFVELRLRTVRSLREAAPAVRKVMGDGVVDSRSATSALRLMSTYSPAVDQRLVVLSEDCAKEKRAHEALRHSAREWIVATYARKYGAGQASGRPIFVSGESGRGKVG